MCVKSRTDDVALGNRYRAEVYDSHVIVCVWCMFSYSGSNNGDLSDLQDALNLFMANFIFNFILNYFIKL